MMKYLHRLLRKLRGEMDIDSLKEKGLSCGNNVFVNFGCVIDESFCYLVSIGNNVTLAPRVHILAHDASTKNEIGYTKVGRVSIGNSVFIGAGTIILPGVSIGNRVVIGAGSVVTRSIPDNTVVVGNPAKPICTYDEYMNKNMKSCDNCCVDLETNDSHFRERVKKELENHNIIFVK